MANIVIKIMGENVVERNCDVAIYTNRSGGDRDGHVRRTQKRMIACHRDDFAGFWLSFCSARMDNNNNKSYEIMYNYHKRKINK